jgi:predicted Zn finger-like uncharacterized protein
MNCPECGSEFEINKDTYIDDDGLHIYCKKCGNYYKSRIKLIGGKK